MPLMLTREQIEEQLSRTFPPEQSAALVEVLDDIRQTELARAADTRELRQGLIGVTEAVRTLAEAQRRTDAAVRGLAEAQARTEVQLEVLTARVDALAEAQTRTEARLEALVEAQTRTEARLEQLAEAQARTEDEMQALAVHTRSLSGDVGEIRRELLERRYRERPLLYFRCVLPELRVLSDEEVVAMTAPSLSDEELDEVLATDIIATGRRPDGTAAYLLAEISQTVRLYDVRRAAERAHLLSQATGTPALSVVAGRRIPEAAEQAACQAGVWRVMDRRTYGPDQPVAREQVAEEEVL